MTDLRQHVASVLPDYMVPSAFVFLDKLPLTPSGKVDRKALPAPEGRPELAGSMWRRAMPPRRALAKIWSEVLRVERVGVNDNFFELGGHSLLATQVVLQYGTPSMFRSQCARSSKTRRLGRWRQVATTIQRARRVSGRRNPPTRQPARREVRRCQQRDERPCPLLKNGCGFSIGTSRRVRFNEPTVLRAVGTGGIAAVQQALTEICRRHEALRTTFTAAGGDPAQVVGRAARMELRLVDLQALAADEREAVGRRLKWGSWLRSGFVLLAGCAPIAIRAVLLSRFCLGRCSCRVSLSAGNVELAKGFEPPTG